MELRHRIWYHKKAEASGLKMQTESYKDTRTGRAVFMEIGRVIRTYRKKKHMTQEEMANCLGVTAPAVNKWENGNSTPDILLLAPIARLLGITVDELLCFKEELTAEEINRFICELDAKLKEEPFDQVFDWAKRRLEEYPDCHQLIWQTAVVLDAGIRIRACGMADTDKYDDYIRSWFVRALESSDETVRVSAAGSLFGFWMRKEEYDKARSCLSYISDQNPEKKRKQALIFEKTGQVEEAYRAYEELLFSSYGNLMLVLNNIYALDVKRQDWERAGMLIRKQSEAARLFEMGRYNEVSAGLNLAAAREDVDSTVKIVKEMMANADNLCEYSHSPLYEHMRFKEPGREFAEELKRNLMKLFRSRETFDYMKDNRWWQELVAEEKPEEERKPVEEKKPGKAEKAV